MAIVSSVIAKVRSTVPESSDMWTDSLIVSVVHQADMIVRETCEMTWNTTDITLVANAIYYPLPVDVIGVGAVQFSEDGTDFTKHICWPTTMDDLDSANWFWRKVTGTRPTHYGLVGAPGASASRILLWPAIGTADGQVVRVKYLQSYVNNNLSMIAAQCPEWIIDSVYLPLTLGLLYGTSKPDAAQAHLQRAFDAILDARGNYLNPANDAMPVDMAPFISRIGGEFGGQWL